jgi:hypothetical protein
VSDDDASDDVQPEAGPLADLLGCEERLEDATLYFAWYPRPVVGDLYHDKTPVPVRFDRYSAVPVYGVRRVVQKVRSHLVELAAVGPYLRQRVLVVVRYGYAPKPVPEDDERALEPLAQVGRL